MNIHYSEDLVKTVNELYEKGETDYYLPPVVTKSGAGESKGRIKKEDSVVFCCRRGDREYQLARALSDPNFEKFSAEATKSIYLVTFTEYHVELKQANPLFDRKPLTGTFGEIIADADLKQVRLAESEKFNHVTYFFNGYRPEPFPGENRLSVKSPEGIKPYEKPELSAPEVGDRAISILKDDRYSFFLVNFANGDVVGHFPGRDPQLACAEALDEQLGRVIEIAKQKGYYTVITADHGLFEVLEDSTGKPSVGHTKNPVPFILVPPSAIKEDKVTLKPGILANIAPTLLDLMDLNRAKEMDRNSLIHNSEKLPRAKKLFLIIMDGWGLGDKNEQNPIYAAKTPNFDRIISNYPRTHLEASGESVGLLSSSAGNSEAGHTNIAAGRIVAQDEKRINAAIEDRSLEEKPELKNAFDKVKKSGANLHLLGLLSNRSSHGRTKYVEATIDAALNSGLPKEKIFVHFFTDGRSTEPGSVPRHLDQFRSNFEEGNSPSIVTLIGRGLALDRDRDWTGKTKVAYEALTRSGGKLD